MKLADYLTHEDIKPTDFARRIGVSSSTITRFLSGDRGLSLELALKITRGTGGKVTTEDLGQPAPASPSTQPDASDLAPTKPEACGS